MDVRNQWFLQSWNTRFFFSNDFDSWHVFRTSCGQWERLQSRYRIKCLRRYTSNVAHWYIDMGVSKNSGIPKSSILIGFPIMNHPLESFQWFSGVYATHTHIVLFVPSSHTTPFPNAKMDFWVKALGQIDSINADPKNVFANGLPMVTRKED